MSMERGGLPPFDWSQAPIAKRETFVSNELMLGLLRRSGTEGERLARMYGPEVNSTDPDIAFFAGNRLIDSYAFRGIDSQVPPFTLVTRRTSEIVLLESGTEAQVQILATVEHPESLK